MDTYTNNAYIQPGFRTIHVQSCRVLYVTDKEMSLVPASTRAIVLGRGGNAFWLCGDGPPSTQQAGLPTRSLL